MGIIEKKTNPPLPKPLWQSSKPLEENLKITIKKTLEITCLQQRPQELAKKHGTITRKS